MPRGGRGHGWSASYTPAGKYRNGPGGAKFSAELARLTKFRTLADMSEKEIQELAQFYGCPVIRRERKIP
jgi:hypothetical protein